MTLIGFRGKQNMPTRVDPKWLADQKQFIGDSLRTNFPYSVITSYNKAAQAVVYYLTDNQIPFKVLNMGAGVKKITTDVSVCPKCKGRGKC